MAITNFIPAVWAARVLENLRASLVYGSVVNTDYEGEIRDKGDRVKINSIGPVTISTYTKNADINAPEALSDSQKELVIDQAKYFNFLVDDVDQAQTQPKLMDAAMREAGYGLKKVADSYIAGLYTGVAAGNTVGDDGTPVVPTASNAYDYLVDLGTILDDRDVPEADRWVIVPSWFHGLLLKDQRFVGKGSAAADETLRTGRIGEVNGMLVYKSSQVPNTAGAKYKIMAGWKGAISYADQIVKVEAYRPEKRFADAVKGLHLYGAKLVRPEAIAVLTANRA